MIKSKVPKTLDEAAGILATKYKELRELEKELLSIYEGKEVKIPHGKFKGRLGVIKHVQYSYGDIICMMYPYKLKGRNKESPYIDQTIYEQIHDRDLVATAWGSGKEVIFA